MFFDNCREVRFQKMGLFDCGILGVSGSICSQLTVSSCDIYDCSFGGIQLWSVDQAVIQNSSFRNLGGPNVMADLCEDLVTDVSINDYSNQEPF